MLGLLLGLLLTSQIVARGYLRSVIFFPVLVSTIGIGITFKILMDPFDGMINRLLAVFGITGPGWLTDPAWRCTASPWSTSGRASASRP